MAPIRLCEVRNAINEFLDLSGFMGRYKTHGRRGRWIAEHLARAIESVRKGEKEAKVVKAANIPITLRDY
jgi:hypothetical protein